MQTDDKLLSDEDSRSLPLKIQPMRNVWLRWFLQFCPWGMLAAVPIIVWPSNPLGIPGQFLFSTGFITATLALFAFHILMQRISVVFDTLWQRGAIDIANTTVNKISTKEPDVFLYIAFIRKVENDLNGRRQWLVSLICICLVLIWYFQRFGLQEVFSQVILTVGIAAEIVIGIVIGLMIWRMLVISIQVWCLPKQFDLILQNGHPDKCGGLEPLGNLCLWNALIIGIVGLFLGGWISFGSLYGFPNAYIPLYRMLLIFPIVFSFLTFLLPLWSTHKTMVAKKAEIEHSLNKLTQSIDKNERDLLSSADTLDPAEGEKRLKKLELMREVYQQNRKIPEWPINLDILFKFLASQTVPILTLLGVSEPILSFVRIFLSGSS